MTHVANNGGTGPETFALDQAVNQLWFLEANALENDLTIDRAAFLGSAAIFAGMLGYNEQHGPVTFGDGPIDYAPGTLHYSNDEHITGLTVTILKAPQEVVTVTNKLKLLSSIVDIASTELANPYSSGQDVIEKPGAMSRAHARRLVKDELDRLHYQAKHRAWTPKSSKQATELGELSAVLTKEWHPYRAKAILATAAVGSVALAVTKLRTRE
jgi:hypothetical protein